MPLWLNADVVRGPGGRDPIPGHAFVRDCTAACPGQGLTLVHYSAQRKLILWDTLGA